jgi:outer membrane protein OmpA-like peptidoglycan-associated protein
MRVGRLSVITVMLAVALLLPALASSEAEDCRKAGLYLEYAVQEVSTTEEMAYALQKAVELCPSHVSARHKLADTLVRLNRLDEAAYHYEKLMELGAKLPDACASLGNVYCIQGRYEMGRKAYEDALALNPADASVHERLEAVKKKIKDESGGFKKADEIIRRVTRSANSGGYLSTMGIAPRTEEKDRIRFNNILFREWSYEINGPESINQLNEVGKALRSGGLRRLHVLVEGHTDDRGGFDRNEKLSLDRAESVKKYLVERCGVDSSRIDTNGCGYSRPLFPNDTPEHRQENRRVEIVFSTDSSSHPRYRGR